MTTRSSKHRSRTGRRRSQGGARVLARATGMLLVVGAVGAAAVQLLAEPASAGLASPAHRPTLVAAADDTVTANVARPSWSPERARPLVETGARSEGPGTTPEAAHGASVTATAPAAAAERLSETANPGAARSDAQRALRSRLAADADDDTRLAAARTIMAAHGSEDGHDLLLEQGLDVIAALEPDTLAPTLHALFRATEEGTPAETTVSHALSHLARDDDALGSHELEACYEAGPRRVQLAAATALASRGDDTLQRRFRDRCVDELDHADGGVRAAAVRDLAAQRESALVELVSPLLGDADHEVRMQSVQALARSGGVGVIDRLRPLVDDEEAGVRRAAQNALARLDRGRVTAR